MGFGFDDVAGAVGDGLEKVGDGVEYVSGKAADGLDHIGLEGAAEGVRDAGEWTADKLGADVAERQLGETEDPKEIIHGDVEKLTERAEHLRDFFKAFEKLGQGLKGLDVHGWEGEAGEAFREEFAPQPKFWIQAADACEGAGKALVEYASTVQWAQGQAKEAVALYKKSKAASDKAVDAYNAKADAYNKKLEAGQDPGEKPGSFQDPGKAGLERARHMVDEARRQRDDAARQATGAVKGLVEQAPEMPGTWEMITSAGRDYVEGMALNSMHLVGGALKGLGETVGLVRMLNPTDPYNMTHPGQYLTNLNGVATGLASTVAHPERLVGMVKNANWRDPAEALGKIAIDLVGGKGAGGAVKGGLKGGAKAAGKEAVEQGAKQTARRTVTERLKDLAREFNCKVLRNEPVDMATGRMVLPQTDVALPGSFPLTFTRTFESAYRNGGWFGPAWASTVDERLEVDAEGVVHVADDGSVRAYPHPAPDLPATPVEGVPWTLEREPDGSYRLFDPVSRITRTFGAPAGVAPGGDGVARLASLSDSAGGWISVEWDMGQPYSLTHSGGYDLRFTCEGGRIVRLSLVTAEGPVTVKSYGYSDRGFLTSVADSENRATRYDVDDHGRIVKWTDSNGRSFSYVYDDEDRCIFHEGEAGHLRARFEYGLDSDEIGCTLTRVTDSLGFVSRFTVDADLRILAETDRAGRTTRTTYDPQHRPLTITNALGETVGYTYDECGRPLAVERPDGTTASIMYDESGNATELRDADGSVTRRSYDEAGLLTSMVQPDGATTTLAYDSRGHVASVTNALGESTRIDSDRAGLPLRVTDPLGATVVYVRDAFGRPVAVTDPLGNTMRMRWTVEGKLAERVNPEGAVERWEWDGEGNLLRHTDEVGGVTENVYTDFDLLEARTDPDGTRHHFTYDTELRLREVTNPQGLTWVYDHDPNGLVISETDFDGRRLYYWHDEAGRLSMRSNALGQSVSYHRDALGNITRKNVDGDETHYTYDPSGRLLTASTLDAELVLQRDQSGRLRTEMYDGRVLAWDRDALGRPVRRVTPSGAVTSYVYDASGNRISLDLDGHTLASSFDATGRELTRTVDSALNWANTWDPSGRLTDQSVTANSVVQQRSYTYRDDGYLTGLDDRLNGSRCFRLDRAGRVTQVTGRNWTESYAYDEAGNLTQAHWPTSHGESAVGAREFTGTRITKAGQWTYVHDEAGRVTERRKTRLSRKPAVWRYTWDAEDRLTTCTTPDGTVWTYCYDPLGRRTAKQRLDENGQIAEETVFTWDGTQVIEQTTTGTADRAIALTWEYDGLTPAAQSERALTTDTQQAVDARFFAIITDLIGTPTELVTPDGQLVWRTRTTLWGTTAVARGSTAHTPLRHPGQYADPETGLHYNLNRHYDPNTARYVSQDPLGLSAGPNPAWYGPNPSSWVDPLGLALCRAQPRLEDGNLKEGWQHIDSRHITGDHPKGHGDLLPPNTTRDQVEKAAQEIVKKGTRQSDPARDVQVFERRMVVNGMRANYRLVVDSSDGNRIITFFPMGKSYKP